MKIIRKIGLAFALSCALVGCVNTNNGTAQDTIHIVTHDMYGPYSQFHVYLYFESWQKELDDDMKSSLKAYKAAIPHDDGHTTVIGRADATGPAPTNKRLAGMRAGKIARYLVSLGIPQDHITVFKDHPTREDRSRTPEETRLDRRSTVSWQ